MKKMRNKKRKKNTSTSIIDSKNDDKANVIFDEDIVCDILSRLPVKYLLRFKCVSKGCRSLIQDPYFVDLHFTRSKSRQHFFVAEPIPEKLNRRNSPGNMNRGTHPMRFLTADTFLQESGIVNSATLNSAIHTMKNTITFSYGTYQGPVNGLICFADHSEHSVCIYNISTRDVTPWVKSTLHMEVKEKYSKEIYTPAYSYGFGFDPATKEYKVVCKWMVLKWETDNSEFWEVLTVGQNTWRTIKDIPPFTHGFADSGVYVNGSIYWCTWKGNGDADFIVAFDVGCEKLRTIHIPNFILQQPLELDHVPFGRRFRVLEVDGHLAIPHKINPDTIKVWVYEDVDKERSNAVRTDTYCENRWNEKSVTLPVKWHKRRYLYFHTAVGTGQMIIETHRKHSTEFLYSYDWKNNTFKEITITGIPSIEDLWCEKLFASYTENMFSFSPAE